MIIFLQKGLIMKKFITFVTIDPDAIDDLGHVNFAKLQLLALDAFEGYRLSAGVGIKSLLQNHGLALVLRRSLTDYKKELFQGDHVEIEVQMKLRGELILLCDAKFRIGSKLMATCKWMMAMIHISGKDRTLVKKMPGWIRQAFE